MRRMRSIIPNIDLPDRARARCSLVVVAHDTPAAVVVFKLRWGGRVAWESHGLRDHVARAVAHDLLQNHVVRVLPWLIAHAVALHLIVDRGEVAARRGGWGIAEAARRRW